MSKLYVPNRLGGFDIKEWPENLESTLAQCHTMEPMLLLSERWRKQTFPPAPDGFLLRRLHDEFEEFFENPSGQEAADILILLYGWACAEKVDLVQALKAKVARNIAAEWVEQEDGRWLRVKT